MFYTFLFNIHYMNLFHMWYYHPLPWGTFNNIYGYTSLLSIIFVFLKMSLVFLFWREFLLYVGFLVIRFFSGNHIKYFNLFYPLLFWVSSHSCVILYNMTLLNLVILNISLYLLFTSINTICLIVVFSLHLYYWNSLGLRTYGFIYLRNFTKFQSLFSLSGIPITFYISFNTAWKSQMLLHFLIFLFFDNFYWPLFCCVQSSVWIIKWIISILIFFKLAFSFGWLFWEVRSFHFF